jgi:hypothetical protein
VGKVRVAVPHPSLDEVVALMRTWVLHIDVTDTQGVYDVVMSVPEMDTGRAVLTVTHKEDGSKDIAFVPEEEGAVELFRMGGALGPKLRRVVR